MRAELIYVTAPSEEQLAGIRGFLAKELGSEEIELQLVEDASLQSGFILRTDSKEYDWSAKGRVAQLQGILGSALAGSGEASDEKKIEDKIISILRTNLEAFELEAKEKEIGTVNWVGDGIVNADGIDHAYYGEIVLFDCGVKGMVQDVRQDEIGIILFGRDKEIHEGSRVVRTGKMAGIPVGDAFKGRVVDALGAPIDGLGEIEAEGYRPIENPAPGIVDRKSVAVPMETGLLSIDSMFPIGRGQRELIIGDRQTGKTSIAMDTIMNQKSVETKSVKLTTRITQKFLTEYYLSLPAGFILQDIPDITATKQMMVTENTTLHLSDEEVRNSVKYYIYANGGISSSTDDIALSIQMADEQMGTVMDSDSHIIWERGGKFLSKELSGITYPNDGSSSLKACTQMLLQAAQITTTTSELKGKSPLSMLKRYIDLPVNLTGCTVDEILYFVSSSKPVIAMTGNNSGVLIMSYTTANVSWMDPATMKKRTMSIHSAEEYFKKLGYKFISYVAN